MSQIIIRFHFHCTSIRFVRYSRIVEAERVINHCHGVVLCGKKLTVRPARQKLKSPSPWGQEVRKANVRGGKTVSDTRAGLLRRPDTPHDDSGRGGYMKRGRGFLSVFHRSSVSLDSSRMLVDKSHSRLNGGRFDSFSSFSVGTPSTEGRGLQKVVWDRIPPESCDKISWDYIPPESCDVAVGSCDLLPRQSPKSNKSHDQQMGGLGVIPSCTEYIVWDTIPPMSNDVPCNTAAGLTAGKSSKDVPVAQGQKGKYDAAEVERLMALFPDTDSDNDSLESFEWDDSLLDDVKTSPTPLSSSRPLSHCHPHLSDVPLPPVSISLVSPEDSLQSSCGSSLSESDRASWGTGSGSSAASANELVSQRFPCVGVSGGVATDLVPATIFMVSK